MIEASVGLVVEALPYQAVGRQVAVLVVEVGIGVVGLEV